MPSLYGVGIKPPGNGTPPLVAITTPQNGNVFCPPASITINAVALDQDGSITKVEFYQGNTLLNTDTTAPYSFLWNNVMPGTYALTAKATDNDGNAVSSQPVTVRVDAKPTASITSPANGAVVQPGNVTITANASDTDGTISRVDFYNGTTLLGTDTTQPYSFTWNNVPAGTYTLWAKAIDNDGCLRTAGPVTFRVNARPIVTITSPVEGEGQNEFWMNMEYPDPIPIQVTATDPDGTVTQVVFSRASGGGEYNFATDTTAPYSASFIPTYAGTHLVWAWAYDDDGGSSYDTVPIIVHANPE